MSGRSPLRVRPGSDGNGRPVKVAAAPQAGVAFPSRGFRC